MLNRLRCPRRWSVKDVTLGGHFNSINGLSSGNGMLLVIRIFPELTLSRDQIEGGGGIGLSNGSRGELRQIGFGCI